MLKSTKLILHSKSEYVKGTCHIYEVIDITQCLSIIHQCLLHPPPLQVFRKRDQIYLRSIKKKTLKVYTLTCHLKNLPEV